MLKTKGLFKKKWVKIVIVVIVVLMVGVCALFFINKNKKQSMAQDFTYVRTVTLGYGSLDETVVATGTIESQNTSTITSSVNNATVSKINYSVGDYVEEGDVIIELDTTNLSKQISKASESVSDQEEKLQDTYDKANENYYDIEEDYSAAKNAYTSAKSAFDFAKKAVSEEQTNYDNLVAKRDALLTKGINEGKKLAEITANDSTYVDTDSHNYDYYDKQIVSAKAELDSAKATTNYTKLEEAFNTAYANYAKLKSSLSQAEDTLDSAYESLTEGANTDTLDDLYDTAADYKLKAKSSGQITSINAVLGSSTNGTLATIQDTSKLKIALIIDEYDILKLELGMKAKIETDASDTVYDGVVSVISPVATSSMGSSGFEIEVDVTSEDVSKLLIGMNAQVTIILSSTEENFTVPIDAVETKNDGTSVIYVEDEDGEFYEVEVTTGENNGYYVEIFGEDLSVGMKVRASADASEAEVTITEDEISEEGFNPFSSFGGGGNMPSGGGNMPSGNMPSGGGGMPSGGPDGR